ncbi:hypothetical protein C491_00847 [Natronococcus amylolyticus DSM 10524]|uniref:DUF7577 domain-containing protein n=1 Tax=Natronococcus amylolyticus DSM 10524 TaxID=1227497 RepID=L9XIW3_9EURY|nr:hypothetical protein [Natronococcus amylolyticus]ELY61361.1 hypothetical protein C491_00847 [Natronococcus amylolyticus DSM 10524]
MELWGWLVGYVVLFALLHLLLYYVYVRREDGDGVQSPSVADPGRGQSHSSPGSDGYHSASDGVGDTDDGEVDADIDGETIRCPHCGTRNDADQTFTYCWNCVSGLRQ